MLFMEPVKVAVETELKDKDLQQHPFLIMKIIQLSDSQLTRHCNMLVGRYIWHARVLHRGG